MSARRGARYGQGMKVGDQFMWPEDGAATSNFWTVMNFRTSTARQGVTDASEQDQAQPPQPAGS